MLPANLLRKKHVILTQILFHPSMCGKLLPPNFCRPVFSYPFSGHSDPNLTFGVCMMSPPTISPLSGFPPQEFLFYRIALT